MTQEEEDNLNQMQEKISQASAEVGVLEDDMYEAEGPKGRFSKKAMNALIKTINDMARLFGLEDKFPPIPADATAFPPDIVRIISMFQQAVSDAVEADILPEDAMVEIEGITDDSGVQVLAGKLQMAAKDKKFHKFLKKPQPKVEIEIEMGEEEEGMEPEEMSESDMDKMFMSRM